MTICDFDTDETEFPKIYFNLEGRKLESKRDNDKRDWKCFDFVYPVTFTMPDGSIITVTSDKEEGWEELKDWYEQNPESEERPTLQFPVDILYEDDTTLTVNSDEEMREAKENCDPRCFDLVYPVTFTMPDGSIITVTSDDEEGWDELKNWYDDNPNSEERPTLEYPVEIIYEDGTTATVNNEEEMREAKENCIRCLALVFPVTFTMPDGSSITVTSNDEEGWEELKNWYEANPDSEFEWNLQYPINVIFEDGTTTTVNSESEMIDIKESCE